MVKKGISLLSLAIMLLFAGCIENDIPYPIVEAEITAIEVEGQTSKDATGVATAQIDKVNRKVTLYVNDGVDLKSLKVTKLMVSNDALIIPDSAACHSFASFPRHSFESLDSVAGADVRMDFSSPVTFTLRTYQDYQWTVDVQQVVLRRIVLSNQIGEPVIDAENRTVVIYVSDEQPLESIKVSTFNLGGEHGRVVPNPVDYETFDFSQPVEFNVAHSWEGENYTKWKVFVYHKEGAEAFSSSVFPMAVSAHVNGSMQSGKSLAVEYRAASESAWRSVAEENIIVDGTTFKTEIKGLTPGTDYHYRVNIGGVEGVENSFTTAPTAQLPNGSFDAWHQVDRLWNPWAADGTSFWDTGNRGATTVGNSNSVPTSDTSTGEGSAALLESKYIVMKFAAGNIFTGDYVKTVGTNGVLSFGRPFTTFPTKLRVNYKCEISEINRCGDDDYAWLKGRPDSCHIYVMLTDWDEPREIRTRPSERQLIDLNDPHIIAYGELVKGENVTEWTSQDIILDYRVTDRRPKYIAVVASASKYGDFFTGGEGTKLWIDNFELLYE